MHRPKPTPTSPHSTHWTPAAQERALEALRARATRTWTPFWCPNPDCDGRPHDKWPWNHARTDQRPPTDHRLAHLAPPLRPRHRQNHAPAPNTSTAPSRKVPRVAIIGGTAPDVRGIMIEGESGLLTIAKPDFRPHYEPSKRRITWPNGAVGMIFSAEEPDRLRGPEHYAAWWDEPAHAPLVQEAWDNLMFGLRLGNHPRVVCTTTPRPRPWLKELRQRPHHPRRQSLHLRQPRQPRPRLRRTHHRHATKAPASAAKNSTAKSSTTSKAPCGHWDMIETDRIPHRPRPHRHSSKPLNLVRIVVAVDPAGSSRTQADETAIIVAGRAADGHLYILDDRSGHYTPLGWATAANHAAEDWNADAVVAETNFGGEMVASQLRMAGYHWRLITIHAKRAKAVRAEPIVGLYEQHLVHHVGIYPELEDQLISWVPYDGADSPDRLDALVYALTSLATRPGTISIATPVRAHLTEENSAASHNPITIEPALHGLNPTPGYSRQSDSVAPKWPDHTPKATPSASSSHSPSTPDSAPKQPPAGISPGHYIAHPIIQTLPRRPRWTTPTSTGSDSSNPNCSTSNANSPNSPPRPTTSTKHLSTCSTGNCPAG